MNRHAKVAVAFLFGATSVIKAATINYVGPGTDLAAPANWSGAWTSADTLVVSTNNVEIPSEGLTLSGDLPSSASLTVGRMPDSHVPVNFGGHALNTKLTLNKMHDDSGRFNSLLVSGGWKGVSQINFADNNACLYLTNGVFEVEKPFAVAGGKWNDYLHILKGATLVVTNITAGLSCFASTYGSILDINGGTMKILGRTTDEQWRQLTYQGGSSGCSIKIRNGGAYIDETALPQDNFIGSVSMLIDGGSYIATNSTKKRRNTIFAASGPFAVTNGVVRIAQLYTGKYQKSDLGFNNEQEKVGSGCRFTFHNSEETFGFKAGTPGGDWGAGFAFSPATSRSSLRLSGDNNAWRSHCLMLNGKTNAVDVAGGTFAVTNILRVADGDGCSLAFSGGVSQIANLTVTDTATNFTIRVSDDASVDVASLALNRETTFKFAISGDGFATAPVKCGATAANGNFRFEFDASGFTWPESLAKVPLISDEGGFAGWGEGGTALDINALNAEYADALPVGYKGVKSRFKLDDGGKTLSLVMPKGIIIAVF